MRIYISRLFFLLGLIPVVQQSFSQDRKLGTWKMFMPYANSMGACDAGSKVYAAGIKSIFSYEKSSGIIQTYDKASGLSDIGFKTFNYDPNTGYLGIAYINSNLDFIHNGTDVYNIPDIKNQATSGAVNIYSISFLNGNAYISSDLGISVINLSRMEITNTYVIGSGGNQVTVYATSFDSVNIYAATKEGLKYASRNAANLQDFNAWQTFGPAQNLPRKTATYVQAFSNKVYAVIPSGNGSDTLYQYNGTNWLPFYAAAADTITNVSVSNGNLYFTAWDAPNGGR